jgi:hypothetical protein
MDWGLPVKPCRTKTPWEEPVDEKDSQPGMMEVVMRLEITVSQEQ